MSRAIPGGPTSGLRSSAETDAPCPAHHVPDPRLELIEGLWRDAPRAQAKPEEPVLRRWRHCALRVVELRPNLFGKGLRDRCDDPFAGAAAANIYAAIARVAAEIGP